MSLEARLQAASADYQKLQIDYSNAVEARQKLDAQLSENELVKKVCFLIAFFISSSSSIITVGSSCNGGVNGDVGVSRNFLPSRRTTLYSSLLGPFS